MYIDTSIHVFMSIYFELRLSIIFVETKVNQSWHLTIPLRMEVSFPGEIRQKHVFRWIFQCYGLIARGYQQMLVE